MSVRYDITISNRLCPCRQYINPTLNGKEPLNNADSVCTGRRAATVVACSKARSGSRRTPTFKTAASAWMWDGARFLGSCRTETALLIKAKSWKWFHRQNQRAHLSWLRSIYWKCIFGEDKWLTILVAMWQYVSFIRLCCWCCIGTFLTSP